MYIFWCIVHTNYYRIINSKTNMKGAHNMRASSETYEKVANPELEENNIENDSIK